MSNTYHLNKKREKSILRNNAQHKRYGALLLKDRNYSGMWNIFGPNVFKQKTFSHCSSDNLL